MKVTFDRSPQAHALRLMVTGEDGSLVHSCLLEDDHGQEILEQLVEVLNGPSPEELLAQEPLD